MGAVVPAALALQTSLGCSSICFSYDLNRMKFYNVSDLFFVFLRDEAVLKNALAKAKVARKDVVIVIKVISDYLFSITVCT